ncbi:MAG: bifunctional nuclease family protein [Deltaproteobacteria bacterium]|nr:bifunctional nuclease family protein [Deltaproteobacteria bacterium]
MTQKKHKGEKEIVSMKILGLIFDPNLNTTVVVLLDAERERVLPIWIGPMEGNAIAIGMEKVSTPRPMTHDLLKNLLDQFQVEVKKVIVTELKDDTFYAVIHLIVDGKEVEIDSRPSDAIALAVRVEAPICCAEGVMQAAADLGLLKQRGDFDESEDLKKWLEGLKPDDFGKYKM